MKCATVQLSIKDEFLRVIQRQRTQKPPTDISREIADTAYSILVSEWSIGKPIRMLTVTATNLVRSDMSAEQIGFFDENSDAEREKNKKREETIDKIRQKYGNDSLVNAAAINTDIGIYER